MQRRSGGMNRGGTSRPTRWYRRDRRGLTLIEAALTTIIVGVAVLAMVSAQEAFHEKNRWSSHAGTAIRLGNEIREMTLNLPRHDPVTGYDVDAGVGWGPELNETAFEFYDDLDDFDGNGAGIKFSALDGSGPLTARREIINNMSGWEQTVTVYNVDPFDMSTPAADGSTIMMMVQVVVTFQGADDTSPQEITRMSWIAPN